jgi:biotin-dependent carboxylase-like uncharacterized protein
VSALLVEACGPMSSLQDLGRFGWQRFGVSSSGAMDSLALAAANALVGNPPGTAAVELVLLGCTIAADQTPVRVAVAGAPATLSLDGQRLPAMTSILIEPWRTLTVGPMQAGIYAYLAVEGGFALPAVLGSLSLQQRAKLGGLEGRALRAGDRLPVQARRDAADACETALDPLDLGAGDVIRVVLGPQADYFSTQGVETFLGEAYSVSAQADRMGYRMSGPRIEHARGFNIVSDGIVTGSVQVPGTGEPIVTMADRQTTGGYPKIATVISADLRILAQRRAGEAVRFSAVHVEEAQAIARERAKLVDSLPGSRRAIRGGLPSVEDLLGMNLAGAAVDGTTAGP